MPTPLQALGVASPGWKGLNLRASGGFLDPTWATLATNFVFDEDGRLATRKGWTKVSTTDATEEIEQIYEYVTNAGAGIRILSTASFLYSESSGTLADITGTMAPSDGNWKFQNWNDGANILTLGLNNNSTGTKYIQWTGTGNATAVVVTGTAPDGDDLMVAWGRVWGTHSNNTVIKYSVVLSHTDWSGATSGTIDMYNVFHEGMDTITAIVPFNGQLVVFGKNNIVIYGDAANPGFIDPTSSTFTLVDHIIGAGCIARDSIQNVGSDLFFLDVSGVRSLGRLIQERSAPLTEETVNVRDHLAIHLHSQTDMTAVRSTYNQEEGFYLLSLPDLNTPEVYCLDMRGRLEDGSRRITEWNSINPSAMFTSRLGDNKLYMGNTDGSGFFISQYDGTTDNGTDISVEYQTGWVTLAEGERYVIPKKIAGIFQTTGSHQLTFKWLFDFKESLKTATKLLSGSSGSQFGIAQYGIDAYTSGEGTKRTKAGMRGFGEHIKYGFSTETSTKFAVSKLEIHSKLGRMNA